MSDILGHDVDGRPLRAGDQVVIVRKDSVRFGQRCAVTGACACGCSGLTVDIKSKFSSTGYKSAYSSSIRKVDNHQPADESFGDLMNKLNGLTA